MPHQILKTGRRSPKNHPALALGRLLTGTLPPHPADADYLAALGGGWKMLGNDQYGDCVAVTWSNERRLVTTTLTATPNYPPIDQVIEFYKTQNPDFPQQDDGMEIQTALEYLVKQGGPDGVKAVAFAKVDFASPDEVKAAIAIFGSVWTGINVQDDQQDQFSNGDPWDWNVNGEVEGGHSIVTGGYGAPGKAALGGDERFITWAQETSFTDRFWKDGVEEAWVVIWPEHFGSQAFLQGVNIDQLASDYQAITGKTLPVPAPSPTPVPVPVPVPTPEPAAAADADMAAAVRTYLAHKHVIAETQAMAAAGAAWLAARDL